MIVVACIAIIAGGWIAIGAIAWLAQILLRVVATITVAAWHLFEGDERRYRRLRPWYRG